MFLVRTVLEGDSSRVCFEKGKKEVLGKICANLCQKNPMKSCDEE